MPGGQRRWRPVIGLVAVLAVVLTIVVSPTGARQQPIPSTQGHAQIIAQGVVSFTAGAHHWRLATNDVGTAPVAIDLASPTFLVAGSRAFDAAPVRIKEPDGLGWLLADGEATFRPAGSAASIDPTPGGLLHEDALRDQELVTRHRLCIARECHLNFSTPDG